jgi:hypothetical protein
MSARVLTDDRPPASSVMIARSGSSIPYAGVGDDVRLRDLIDSFIAGRRKPPRNGGEQETPALSCVWPRRNLTLCRRPFELRRPHLLVAHETVVAGQRLLLSRPKIEQQFGRRQIEAETKSTRVTVADQQERDASDRDERRVPELALALGLPPLIPIMCWPSIGVSGDETR